MLPFNRLFFKSFLGSFFIFMAGAGLAPPSFAEKLPSLFQIAPKGALGDLAVSVSQDQILASVDFSLLSGKMAPKRMQVALPGRTVVIKKTKIVRRGEDDYSWFGKVEGFRLSDVVFTVVGGVLVGRLNLDGEIFSLDPKNGFSLITKNDPSLAVPVGDDYLVPPIPAGAPRKAERAPPALGAADDGSVIDIMVLYTQAFATKYASSLSATIQAMVDLANTAYTNSGVNTQVRLAHSELFTDSTVSESTPISTALSNFRALSSVATLRNTYKADLVTLFRVYDSRSVALGGYGSTSCGLGYIMNRFSVSSSFSSYGFSVVENRRASEGRSSVYCWDNTMAHEMGHNMGCAHDRANDSCNESSLDWNCPAYPYSYGYIIPGISYGTIMSYPTNSIEYFSTPNKTYSGYPIGIAAGQTDAADCVSTFNATTPIIAQFQLGTTTSTTTSLSAPTGLSATASGNTVSVSWNAVSGATGYKLYYGTTSGSYSGSADLGNVTSKSITGVFSGTYYLAVTAYNSSSESAKSTETSVTVIQLSAPVMTLRTSGLNGTVSWTSVSGATGYTLYYAPYPSATPIGSASMGTQTSLSVTLSAGASYYVAIKAYNSTGSSNYSNSGLFVLTTASSGTTVTDVEGNVYNTVTIGKQVWMKENLKVTKYRDGTAIGTTATATTNFAGVASPKYQWAYNGDETNVSTYGRLYTWHAATDSRGICPTGWHMSTDTEWTTLKDYLGGSSVAGGKMKEAGTTHWSSPNTGADNSSGFTALPGGSHGYDGAFHNLGSYGRWWSATEANNTSIAWFHDLGYVYDFATRDWSYKRNGFSVRCVRD